MKLLKTFGLGFICLLLLFSTLLFPSSGIDSKTVSPTPTSATHINYEEEDDNPNIPTGEYVVFAWNDLGMHCANPTYDTAVLLPPYNTLWVQVIQRGDPPRIVTQGLTVDYHFINNTYSYGKRDYGQFWDNAQALFGAPLARDTGLNLSDPNQHNGLSGTMSVKSDHFEAVGTPLTPVDDNNLWNPYQVAEFTVKDSTGAIVAQTRTTAPVSDEINCARCHGNDPFNDILVKHDQLSGTTLQNQKPVLCAGCHGDPALGMPQAGPDGYLSESIHGFHGNLADPPSCYDCHPGQATHCSRSISHTASDGNCTTCHGDLNNMSMTITAGRIPWADEPKCVACHTGVAQVDTGNALYRNSTGHGGVYCTSCHSSPHAMVPSSEAADNYQAMQYQGKAVPIGDCAACHLNSKGGGEGGLSEYLETHGGLNPEHSSACNVCHTAVNTAVTTQWPHSFQWKMAAGSGTTLFLNSSLNPSRFGQSVTFTASVQVTTQLTDKPSGTVFFRAGSTTLGSMPLNNSGKAVFSTSALSAGSHSITAEYSGDFNYSSSFSNTVVQVVNSSLSLTSDPVNQGDVGVPYSVTLYAHSGATPYKWSIAKSAVLPKGLSLKVNADTTSAEIKGKPLKANTFNFRIIVTDRNGEMAAMDVSVKINPAVKISVPKNPAGDPYVAYTTPAPTASFGAGFYIWSFTSKKGLPPGLTFDPDTGIISGTPATPGTYYFTLMATDTLGSAARKNLSIKINKVIKITTVTLPAARVGRTYSKTLKATGGTGKYSSWALADGSAPLPAWVDPVKFSSKGIIATLRGSKVTVGGPYNLKFRVTDTLGGSAESDFLVLEVR